MKRPLIIFAVTLAALCACLVALFGTIQARDTALRGYRNPLQTTELPFWMPRLGVNAELLQYDSQALQANLDRMQAANIHWVRQFFAWDDIEPEQGNYDWDKYDDIVEQFRENPDLQLVAVLAYSPEWAYSRGETDTAPPDDPADFAAFARALAERYGDVIDAYQIWDEPNLENAWGNMPPNPADYLALLSAAYDAIHQGDAHGNAQVIAAALAPTTETGPENISDILYLRDLYALGAADYMDAVAGKPFGFDTSSDDRRVDTSVLNFSRLIALREVMEAAGDDKTPLWASAWGWNSLPEDWSGEPSIWGSVSAEERTAYTLAALDRAEQEWAWLGGAALYTWQPDAPADDPRWGFTLIASDGSPTPLYEALVSRPPQTTASNGLYFAANPFTEYSGLWQFSDLGADTGWVEDSRLAFHFQGADAGLLLREDDYVALLYPTIDGGQANALPVDSAGNSFIQLTSDTLMPALTLLPVARGIGNADHTLQLVADRGWDQWAIAGFAVSSGDLAAPYQRQIAVALVATALATISLVVASRQVQWSAVFRPFGRIWRGLSNITQIVIAAVTSVALLIGMLLTWGGNAPDILRREPIPLGLALATAGLIYVSPSFLVTIAAAAVLFVIIYNRLVLGLLLCVVSAPFFLFPVELYRFAFPMAEMTILITSAAWALKSLANWGRSRQSANTAYPPPQFTERLARLTLLDWGVMAWVCLGTLAISWSAQRGIAITEWRTLFVEPALFYLILRTTRLEQRDLVLLIDGLLFAGVLVCVIGLFQFMRGDVIIAEGGARRLASVYGSPNNAALFLERCLPFALAFLLYPLHKQRRVISALVVGLMLFTILLTQSAGALFLGVPISIALVLILVWGRRASVALIALFAVAVGLLIVLANTSDRFARLFTGEGTSFFRVRVWQSAMQMIRDNPITGLGLDQFLYAYRGRYILPDAWQEPNLSHPHNILLDFWIRLGILGVVLLIFVQIAFWRSAFGVYRRLHSAKPLQSAIIVGAMGAMAGLLAHGLVDNSAFVNDLAFIFILILSLPGILSNIPSIDGRGEIVL
jgi:O-antigen ligase